MINNDLTVIPNDKPLIETVNIEAGHAPERSVAVNEFVFTLEGSFSITVGDTEEIKIDSGLILILPQRVPFRIDSPNGCRILSVRFGYVDLCYSRGEGNIFKGEGCDSADGSVTSPGTAILKDEISLFLRGLVRNIEEGLTTQEYYINKIKELHILLLFYYTPPQLGNLFAPVVTKDNVFTNKVIGIVDDHKTVSELATRMNYSLSGFTKRFTDIFGMPPYKWMKQRKAAMIRHELISGTRPIKELSYLFGFKSPNQFSDFCKENLGQRPGEIRRQAKKN